MSTYERFEDLLGRELAGPLTPEESVELDAMCQADPTLAEQRKELVGFSAGISQALATPPLDFATLKPEQPPEWAQNQLREAIGADPWGEVKTQAEERRQETKRAAWWRSPIFRWATVAAVLTLVAAPVIQSLRDGHQQTDEPGVRGWQSQVEGGAVQLAPVGDTLYAKPSFIWLPAPGKTGPVTVTLWQDGKMIWEKAEVRSPLPLDGRDGVPSLQSGVTYEWRVKSTSAGEMPAARFRLAAGAAGAPAIAPSAAEAVAAARSADQAGRPHDALMLLAILPAELRADDSVRALRLELMEKTGLTPAQAKP